MTRPYDGGATGVLNVSDYDRWAVIYSAFRPRAELSSFVTCTWERDVPDTGGPSANRVLPDGAVDLVVRGDELFVAGPDTGPFMSPLPPGETIAGLRLRRGVAGQVLGMSATEVRDSRVSLADLWGRDGVELTERIAGAGTPGDRRRALEEAVVGRVSETGEPDPLVLAATRQLGRPGTRVGTLSDALGTSERQLLRRFKAAVGYGPKTFDRVLRFQRFLAAARGLADGDETLARLAAELGYADQAHLNRECLRLSGLTPRQLVELGPV